MIGVFVLLLLSCESRIHDRHKKKSWHRQEAIVDKAGKPVRIFCMVS